MRTRVILLAIVTLVAMPIFARSIWADDGRSEVQRLRQEVRRLRDEAERNRQRMEDVERKLEQLESKQQTTTQEVQEKVATEVAKQATEAPRRYLERYWGDNRFVITGYGAGSFEWRRNENTNTFLATMAPIFLFRVTDRVLFEGELELALTDGGGTDVNLEYAQADVFLNDYMTFVGGKFLLPFGEFIQQLHPAWINKLVSFPLPYRENEEGGLIPFSDVGVQLRGGVPFGPEGVGIDYTAYVSNGPRFESEEVGALFQTNNVDDNKGKGFGARLAVYPLPIASSLGRLKVGASTYDGKWDGDHLWFTSWGVDTAYQLAEIEFRGEYLQTRREMPEDIRRDLREGWYAQVAYKLARLQVPHVNRMELIARYSGVNQRAVTNEELLPHPRQVALGLDYWVTPSVVAKLEYDRELPRDAKNDHAVRAQIAVGF
jgi:hypothetical protein